MAELTLPDGLEELGLPESALERHECSLSAAYFCHNYCWLTNRTGAAADDGSTDGGWVPFHLWGEQVTVLGHLVKERKAAILKARQLGLTWLVLAYALWLVIFRAGSTVLLFSAREDEAKELLTRIRGMYDRLPDWCKAVGRDTRKTRDRDNTTVWDLPNGSQVLCFPANAGRSYTASLVVVDEADWLKKPASLNELLNAVQPTVDAGGQLFLVSSPCKSEPESHFKRLFRAAMNGANGYLPVFLPWTARPGRTQEWYRAEQKAKLAQTGTLDDVEQEYPACLTAEMRVSTEKGILPICVCGALSCKETESGPIVAITRQPASPIYRLETANGRILRGTADHPVLTERTLYHPGGFVGLSELTPGMSIVLREPRFAESIRVESWQPIPGITTQVEIGLEWGRLLGFFMGDGSWYKGTLDIACDGTDEDVIADVASLVEKLIGPVAFKIVARIQGRKGCTYVRCHRVAALEAFRHIGLVRAATDNDTRTVWKRWVHVPDCIFRSPQPVVREFLRGLFESDGSASGGVVRFASCKTEFVRDVQLLLLGFGINSTIRYEKHKAGSGHFYFTTILALTMDQSALFAELIGFVGKRKQSLALMTKGKHKKRHANLMLDEVQSVTEDGFEETFDFTIGTEHVFSANGILTHNTVAEALAPRSLDKRFPPAWCQQCYRDAKPCFIPPAHFPRPPAIPGLTLYAIPAGGRVYVGGADPAEGNPTSDESAAGWLDVRTGQQVALLAGRYEVGTFAEHLRAVSDWFNRCPLLIERNNHGHAVLLALEDMGQRLLAGPDGKRGWPETTKTKAQLWANMAEVLREKQTVLHDFTTLMQLMSIEGATLKAPEGQHDDRAIMLGLAALGMVRLAGVGGSGQATAVVAGQARIDPRLRVPPAGRQFGQVSKTSGGVVVFGGLSRPGAIGWKKTGG